MKVYKLAKALAYASTLVLFIWFLLLKIAARIAARAGKSSPCPASLAAIVDNPPAPQLYATRTGLDRYPAW